MNYPPDQPSAIARALGDGDTGTEGAIAVGADANDNDGIVDNVVGSNDEERQGEQRRVAFAADPVAVVAVVPWHDRSRRDHDRLMMMLPSGSDGGHEPELLVLCGRELWDEVREWLRKRRRRSRLGDDDKYPNTYSSSHYSRSSSSTMTTTMTRREVSACPQVEKPSTIHFAAWTPEPLGPRQCPRPRTAGVSDVPDSGPSCRCQTALSVACGRKAPKDVVEALWRFCPDQLVHLTFNLGRGYHAGTPLHNALSAVRWGKGGHAVCAGLDLVECLVDADVSVSGDTGREGNGRERADDDEKETTGTKNLMEASSAHLSAPADAPLPPVASRICDNHGRNPLHMWAEKIFPRIMTLLWGQSSDDAEAISAERDVFDRWTVVLRKLLIAWPGACSVPNPRGLTTLMTVLSWEMRVGQLPRLRASGGRPAVMPWRTEVERRLLKVVRILLESDEATSGSCSFGCSPLHYAVAYKQSNAVIGAVLDTSSSSFLTTPLPLCRNKVMEVPLHVAATLSAPLSVIGQLLRRRRGGCSPADQATAVDRRGRSPLTWAYVRFLEERHGLIMGRKNKNGGGTDPEEQGGEAVAAVPDHPNDTVRVKRRTVPRDLTTMEDEVLGSMRQCGNCEELLSELVSFFDVAQLLLIAAYHCGHVRRPPLVEVADAGEAPAVEAVTTATAAETTQDDVRSFLEEGASTHLIQQVMGILTPEDVRGKKWRIVHAAASLCPGCCPRGVLEIAMMVCPEQLREMDGEGRLPLHLAINAWCHAAAATSPEEGEKAMMRRLRGDKDGRSGVSTVLSAFPGAAGVPDGSSRRLPLHIAISSLVQLVGPLSSSSKSTPRVGMSFLRDVLRIAAAHPEALGEGDVARGDGATRGLLPFMLAAAGPGSACLSYELLRLAPEMVSGGIVPSASEETETKGDGKVSCGPSSSSPDIGGAMSSSSNSSSPSSSLAPSIEGHRNWHRGETTQKRARCS